MWWVFDKWTLCPHRGALFISPFIVRISYRLISGFIFTPKYVHSGTALKVRLGSIYLEGNSRHLQEFDIVEVIRHPGYKHLRKYHDIGLFKLDRNVRISKDVRPACLYTDDTNDSSNVIAAGWGTMEASKFIIIIYHKHRISMWLF